MPQESFPCTTLTSLKHSFQTKLEEYKVALEEVRVEGTLGSVERLRVIEAELNNIKTEIEEELNEAGYTLEEITTLSTNYEHPDGRVEDITLDLEATLKDFESFYNTHGIPVPPDFAPKIREIFTTNQTAIENEIKTKGFNKMLVVPGNLSLPDIAKKLEMENGYYLWDDFKNAGGFARAIETTHTENHRLILVHDAKELTNRPELASTLNITGIDAENHDPLSLTDYLVFANHHYTKTGEHLDTTKYTWTSTQAGSGFVRVAWYPGGGQLGVDVGVPGGARGSLGVRPSAVFT